jgi:type II secretory pathway component HofQ
VAPNALLHLASLKTETREVPARSVVALPLTTAKSTDKLPATSAKPAVAESAEKPGLAAAQPGKPASRPAAKKSVDKAPVVTAQAVTKPVRLARIDPLAPLPAKHSKGLTAER